MITSPPRQPSDCSNCVRPQSFDEHFGLALLEAGLLAADRLADDGDGRHQHRNRPPAENRSEQTADENKRRQIRDDNCCLLFWLDQDVIQARSKPTGIGIGIGIRKVRLRSVGIGGTLDQPGKRI
jgi:hypothetical protein